MATHLSQRDDGAPSSMKSRTYYGYLEGWISIALNLVLFGLKYWAGAVSGSVAIMADAWHTLSDALGSIVVIVGTKISSRPADEGHPFGHGRAELIGAVIIAVLLSLVAIEFVRESIERLLTRGTSHYGTLAIVVTIVSIIGKEITAQFAIAWGKKTEMKSLVADGWHHRSDAISSLIILAGIFLQGHFWWIDGVLGLIVSSVLFHTAYSILKEATSALIGQPPDDQLIQTLTQTVAKAYDEELHIHHIHVHDYGNHREVTFHIRLPDDLTLTATHAIVKHIETQIKDELEMDPTVHPEPLSLHP